MAKIPVKKILKELGKFDEYNYPTGEYSLFILPDGKIVGVNQLMCHRPILEKILKRKIETNQEFYDIFAELRMVKIIVSGTNLYVDVCVPCTTEQKHALEGFSMSGKYEGFMIDAPHNYISNAPSENYIRHVMKLHYI